MTGLTTTIGTALAAGALALGSALGVDGDGGSSDVGERGASADVGQRGTSADVGQRAASLDGQGAQHSRTALVIDASRARDGRELVDPRLRDLDAEVRLPRTSEEARTNVRYFDSLGYRVVVAGPAAGAAATAAGVDAVRVGGVAQAARSLRPADVAPADGGH